jgi:hypothetical protein
VTNHAVPDLCHRRSWADPIFECRRSRQGYTCRVRVNNREYTCDNSYATENLAREKAAESAYYICYNFSINDGMYPGQQHGQAGVTQGLPVAIGTGRRTSQYTNDYLGINAYGDTLSRESSPRTSDSDIDQSSSRRSSASSSDAATPVCRCRRGYVFRYARCASCLREAGWY